jgi:hypothetical protein
MGSQNQIYIDHEPGISATLRQGILPAKMLAQREPSMVSCWEGGSGCEKDSARDVAMIGSHGLEALPEGAARWDGRICGRGICCGNEARGTEVVN